MILQKCLFLTKEPKAKTKAFQFGNLTSQFFANIYLNELDQFVTRTLKIKYYVRYMDDFVLLFKHKSECIYYKRIIENFLEEHLHLQLNEKSRYYPYSMGVNFCGYRIFTTHRLLRNKSKVKVKKQVKKWNKLYSKRELDIHSATLSLNSWLGHSSHCSAYKLQQKIVNKCDFLLNNRFYSIMENNFLEDMK